METWSLAKEVVRRKKKQETRKENGTRVIRALLDKIKSDAITGKTLLFEDIDKMIAMNDQGGGGSGCIGRQSDGRWVKAGDMEEPYVEKRN